MKCGSRPRFFLEFKDLICIHHKSDEKKPPKFNDKKKKKTLKIK